MNKNILFGLKNFIYDESIVESSIENAKKMNFQSGGGYLNKESYETNFISDNFVGKSTIPNSKGSNAPMCIFQKKFP